MTIETDTVTAPAIWASALVNGDYSSFSLDDDGGDAEIAAIEAFVTGLAEDGWQVIDVARDADGECEEPHFTWAYALHGGTASGGDVLDYTILRHT
jgi:hypothetical protein